MPRSLTVQTQQMGLIKVHLLRPDEPEWQALAKTPIANLVTVMPRSALEHALHGWSRPFVNALGLPPRGALHKLPKTHHECTLRQKCASWRNAACRPLATDMPICFEPDLLSVAAAEVIRLWREGVYVIVTQEDV